MRGTTLSLMLAAFWLGLTAAEAAPTQDELASTVAALWQADDVDSARGAAQAILASEGSFEEIYGLLEQGPAYASDVPRGLTEGSRKGRDGRSYPYVVRIPEDYDATRPRPVRFYLHGGVDRPAWKRGGEWWRRYQRVENASAISVFPAAWKEALWWQKNQVENLSAILNELKRTYNIDENRVYLFGISDGGTGVYFHALRAPTPWAGFLTFIGHAGVLTNAAVEADGDLFAVNLSNRPLFVVNAENDRLYPARRVMPYIELFRKAGARIQFRHKSGGHDTRWWNAEARRIERFVETNPRDPLPDRIIWETERTDRYHRFAWLVIEELGAAAGESELADSNTLEILAPAPVLGVEPGGSRRDAAGVPIRDVYRQSLAAKAGIRPGDEIVSVDGTETPTVNDLGAALAASLQRAGHGGTVPLVVERDGKRIELTFHHPEEAAPDRAPAFPRSGASGRVELERKGNTVSVRTRGVRRFRLLLSPSRFDFQEPIQVVTNGVVSFEGVVEPSTETLLEWALRDRDRTMLFGAELEIRLRAR